jgi:large subunit ribosomal protein L6
MSKIGKKPIKIEDGVQFEVYGKLVKATGPKGSIELNYKGLVNVKVEDGNIIVEPKKTDKTQYAGLFRTLISNMVNGVKNGFTKELEFTGIGYRANVEGGALVLNVGYSHPVRIEKVDGIEFSVKDNTITVSGIDKVLVGDMAAKIRSVRPPEPYKGKGIKYKGEIIIKKQAKSAA